jgi:hypothetical protein
MKTEHFKSAGAENSYCSFSGSFLYMPDGKIRPTNPQPSSCCGCNSESEQLDARERSIKAQRAVKKRWGSGHTQTESKETPDPGSLDELLERIKYYTLAVSCMAFMDAWTFDVDRARDCYIQVVSRDKKIIPFCVYNLTDSQGKSIYRKW